MTGSNNKAEIEASEFTRAVEKAMLDLYFTGTTITVEGFASGGVLTGIDPAGTPRATQGVVHVTLDGKRLRVLQDEFILKLLGNHKAPDHILAPAPIKKLTPFQSMQREAERKKLKGPRR